MNTPDSTIVMEVAVQFGKCVLWGSGGCFCLVMLFLGLIVLRKDDIKRVEYPDFHEGDIYCD